MAQVRRGDLIDEDILVDLLQRAQKYSDPDAFDGLYLLYADRVFRFLVARLEDSEFAEEVTAQVFLRLIEKIDRFQIAPKDNAAIFSAWLYRLAYNRMVDNLRKRQRARLVSLEQVDRAGNRWESMENIESRIDFEQMLHHLQHLNDQQREVLLLRFIEGLNIAQTAETMAKSEGAIKALQHRALENLRRYIPNPELHEV